MNSKMRKIINVVNWIFKIAYQYSVVKYKNLPINAVFFVSFIFTNTINFVLNITLFTFVINKINAYYYLLVLIIVSIVCKMFFLKKEIIQKIPKRNPTRKEIIILDLIFFSSVILFFGSLAMIT